MLSVTAIHLVPESEAYIQLDLLDCTSAPRSEKQEKLERAMDAIRGKFGRDAISFGTAGEIDKEEPL